MRCADNSPAHSIWPQRGWNPKYSRPLTVTPLRRILGTETDFGASVVEVRKAVAAKLVDGPVQL